MSTVVCWFQRTLKQLEREQTDTQTDRQDDYSNPRACAPRVNKTVLNESTKVQNSRHKCKYVALLTLLESSMFIAERISAKQHNPGCILAVVYVRTCPSRLGMSNVTLRNVNVMLRNVNLLRL